MSTASTGLPTHVLRDLSRLVESEYLGESLFATAAQLSTSEQARTQWRTLAYLETQTKDALHRFLDQYPAVAPINRLATGAGAVGAVGLRTLPERSRLTAIRLGTRRYLPAFERLAAHFQRTQYTPFFDYVVQHEHAIISFTELALAHDRNALDPVMRLLERGAPATE